MRNIYDTIHFVQTAHGLQMYGNVPYIVHLMLVARHFEDDVRKTIALLHDVVEDTDVTLAQVRADYGDLIADAVDALTHRKGEDYLTDYIPRVVLNPIAKAVKLADLEENIYSATYNYPGRYGHLLEKYRTAVRLLFVLQPKDITG